MLEPTRVQGKVGSDANAGMARAQCTCSSVFSTSCLREKVGEHGTDLFRSSPPSSHAEHAPGSAAGSARISLLPWLVPLCMGPVGTGTGPVGRWENEDGWQEGGRERLNEISHWGTKSRN